MAAASRGSRRGPALAAALAALSLVGSPAAHAAPASRTPTAARAYIAHPVMQLAARSVPGGGRILMRLGTETPWAGERVGVLVLGSRTVREHEWLRVRLPERPNHAAGWIRADSVSIATTPWRVTVHLGARRVVVTRAGRTVRAFRAVVGKPSTPTPVGLFAIWERARQPSPDLFDGAWVLHTTAHSNVLKSFGGGSGRIGIHGRGGSSLYDPLGSARSHGCVRISNGPVSWLARRAVPGTPVFIER